MIIKDITALQTDIDAINSTFVADKNARMLDILTDTSLSEVERQTKIASIASEPLPSFDAIFNSNRYVLFNDTLYKLEKKTPNTKQTGGVPSQASFPDGSKVQYMDSPTVYEVVQVAGKKNRQLKAPDGSIVNPSKIVCNYHDKPEGTMAGLSHAGWRLVQE